MENELYHYTTFEALLGILEENNICFWGTRYDSMNDPQDYLFAQNIVIPKAIDWCYKKYGKDEANDYLEIYPYVVSFSEHGDDLNLWRFYHSQVCLILDKELLASECTEQGLQFSKCSYSDKDDINLNISIGQTNQHLNIKSEKYIDSLMECCVFIKNKDYETEGEWRVYKSDYGSFTMSLNPDSGDIVEKEINELPNDVRVRGIKNNDFILYKEFKFSKAVLKGIIIYEQSDISFQKIKKHLELILMSRKYTLPSENITKSKKVFRK